MTDDDENYTAMVNGLATVASRFLIDSIDAWDDDHATVAVLEQLMANVLLNVLLSMHRKGDRIRSADDAYERVTLMLSSMAPTAIDAVGDMLVKLLKLPPHG